VAAERLEKGPQSRVYSLVNDGPPVTDERVLCASCESRADDRDDDRAHGMSTVRIGPRDTRGRDSHINAQETPGAVRHGESRVCRDWPYRI
jgi:hypothetical protein